MKKWLILAASLFAATASYAHTSEEMLHLVNQARSQARQCGGKHYAAAPALKLNPMLQRAAQNHATDMAQKHYFSHTSKDGRNPFKRIQQEDYAFWAAAENIAKGHQTAHGAMNGWLKSAGHCANIMNPNFSEMGMAQHDIYWVQTFGKPR